MAYELPDKHDKHTAAINLIDAQLEKINSGNGKTMHLELLLNQIGGIFKPDEEAPEDDDPLQVVLQAQVHKTNFEHRSALANVSAGPKKTQK